MAKRWHPLAPLTGVLFVAFIIVAFIVGGETPDVDDSIVKIRNYYDDEAKQIVTAAAITFGSVALIFFAGILRSVLRTADEAAERLATVAFGGAVIFAAGLLAFAGFTFTLADVVDKDIIAPQTLQTLNALNSDFFLMFVAGQAVFLIAMSIAILRFGGLPVWTGWAALIIGIASLTPAGFFAFLATLLWSLFVSIWIYRAPAAGAPAAPATV
jgi:hypothetical protein